MRLRVRSALWAPAILLLLPPINQAVAGDVGVTERSDQSFEIRTGDYVASYAPFTDQKGWIHILRAGTKDGIAAKLANGQHLDVTDAKAGEVDIYRWTDARKDAKMS